MTGEGKRIVIAGAGHAAGQVVVTLRQQQFAGQIVLVGDEPWLPYQRPPLSKKFLAGDMPAERLFLKPESFYEDPQIQVQLETRITAIDRDAKLLKIDRGDDIEYDKLVLALGSRARTLNIEGADLEGVHYLRSISDVQALSEALDVNRHLVIIGAGYIGLEVAAVTRTHGHDVTGVDMADRVLSRVVSPECSDFYPFERAHQGGAVRLGKPVAAGPGR